MCVGRGHHQYMCSIVIQYKHHFLWNVLFCVFFLNIGLLSSSNEGAILHWINCTQLKCSFFSPFQTTARWEFAYQRTKRTSQSTLYSVWYKQQMKDTLYNTDATFKEKNNKEYFSLLFCVIVEWLTQTDYSECICFPYLRRLTPKPDRYYWFF